MYYGAGVDCEELCQVAVPAAHELMRRQVKLSAEGCITSVALEELSACGS